MGARGGRIIVKMPKIYGRYLLLCPLLLLLSGCNQPQVSDNQPPATTKAAGETSQTPAGGHPLGAAPAEDEYGEFLAHFGELANVPVNDIIKSIRLNAGAMVLGKSVYDKNCAACHGADLKGSREAHAPDLTDEDWRFSGDELTSGGVTKLPSDVEWTVRYGVRSGNPNARGVEADMLAFDPQYRNQHDLEDYGRIKTVTPQDIDDIAEYVLQLTRQPADPKKASHGKELFLDN